MEGVQQWPFQAVGEALEVRYCVLFPSIYGRTDGHQPFHNIHHPLITNHHPPPQQKTHR